MVQEHERIFMETLHRKLKEKVRAGVCVKIYDDTIKVQLIRDGEVVFDYNIYDFSDKFMHDYTTDMAVTAVINTYKTTILKQHFY